MTDLVNRNMFSVRIGDSFVEDPIVIEYSVAAKMFRRQRLSAAITENRKVSFEMQDPFDNLMIGFAESYEEADSLIREYQRRMNFRSCCNEQVG